MLKKRFFSILFTGWMVLITAFSLFSFDIDEEDRIWFPHLDKIVHFTFHLVLVLLGAFAINEMKKRQYTSRQKMVRLLGFSLSYGLIIEFLQYVMPYNRSAEIWDVLANSSGALIAALLIQMYGSRINRLK